MDEDWAVLVSLLPPGGGSGRDTLGHRRVCARTSRPRSGCACCCCTLAAAPGPRDTNRPCPGAGRVPGATFAASGANHRRNAPPKPSATSAARSASTVRPPFIGLPPQRRLPSRKGKSGVPIAARTTGRRQDDRALLDAHIDLILESAGPDERRGMRTPLELPMGTNFTFMAGFPERKRSQGNYVGIPSSTPRIRPADPPSAQWVGYDAHGRP